MLFTSASTAQRIVKARPNTVLSTTTMTVSQGGSTPSPSSPSTAGANSAASAVTVTEGSPSTSNGPTTVTVAGSMPSSAKSNASGAGHAPWRTVGALKGLMAATVAAFLTFEALLVYKKFLLSLHRPIGYDNQMLPISRASVVAWCLKSVQCMKWEKMSIDISIKLDAQILWRFESRMVSAKGVRWQSGEHSTLVEPRVSRLLGRLIDFGSPYRRKLPLIATRLPALSIGATHHIPIHASPSADWFHTTANRPIPHVSDGPADGPLQFDNGAAQRTRRGPRGFLFDQRALPPKEGGGPISIFVGIGMTASMVDS